MWLCELEYGNKGLPASERTIRYHTCPANLVDPFDFQLLSLYAFYKDGHLLYPGGVTAQPPKYLQAMRVIAGEVSRIEERRMEREKSKRK